MSSIPERIVFLKKIHLFHGLSDDDLNDLAQAMTDEPFEAGKALIEEGTRGDMFYAIYRGTVEVTRGRGKDKRVLANLVPQDFFGEEEYFTGGVRAASISATSNGSLLSLHYRKFDELFKRVPRLKLNFGVAIQTHRLWRKLNFKWVRADEVVYFLARKHPILLWRALALPIAALAVPIAMTLWGMLAQVVWVLAFAFLVFLAIAAWAAWLIVDWGNDYYMVTNQRVVWLEKVVGIFESRTEAPLSTILSVGVETDAVGRLLDYGHVIVRTFVGKIPFNHVSHPHQASHVVEEYWRRTKERSLSMEKEAIRDAIRKRLDLPVAEKPAPESESAKPLRMRRPTVIRLLLSNLFKLRLEEGETVTYRKHRFVLFGQIWLPSLFLFALFAGWLARIIYLVVHPEETLISLQGGLTVDSLILALPVVSIPFWGWWAYQYADWKNDIFIVTPDQIIDIDKKPFGTEERRVASLENILSIESERVGFLGNIFNYGTVYITVGGSKLEFQDVYDPPSVQSDIDRRRMARVAAKNAALAASERERMAEWLATYYNNADEFRREQQEQRERKQPE